MRINGNGFLAAIIVGTLAASISGFSQAQEKSPTQAPAEISPDAALSPGAASGKKPGATATHADGEKHSKKHHAGSAKKKPAKKSEKNSDGGGNVPSNSSTTEK